MSFSACAGRGVVAVVAELAECREIEQAGGLGAVVVDVSNCEDHAGSGYGVRFSVLCMAPFAPGPRPVESDKPGSNLPVGRVAGFHFWTNGHQ